MIGRCSNRPQTLQALKAAAEWLNSAGWPERFAALSTGRRAAHLCNEYGVGRRTLDLAINAVKDGWAYPSQEFLDACEMAERLAGRPLTIAEVAAIADRYFRENSNEID